MIRKPESSMIMTPEHDISSIYDNKKLRHYKKELEEKYATHRDQMRGVNKHPDGRLHELRKVKRAKKAEKRDLKRINKFVKAK